jgi:hypothetical protein
LLGVAAFHTYAELQGYFMLAACRRERGLRQV